MMENIPQILYRGDSDPNRARKLKASWDTGFLLTNLSDSGSGREIFSTPLLNLICRHIDIGWSKTHFLSFSECPDIAFKFATGRSDKELVASSENNWDAIVIHLCKDKFTSIVQVENGIYQCQFEGKLPTGVIGTGMTRLIANTLDGRKTTNILLIDTISCLKKSTSDVNASYSLEKAKRDREWLVLPIDSAPDLHGEFTCLLDDGCLSKVMFYKFA